MAKVIFNENTDAYKMGLSEVASFLYSIFWTFEGERGEITANYRGKNIVSGILGKPV